MDEQKVLISIVAPVFNEEDNIEKNVRYWYEIIKKDNLNAEIVLTNDGSTDNTMQILEELKKEISCLKVISYPKNRGYGKALSSSIKNSCGKYLLTIDSDGQFDASEYKPLLNKLEKENLDAVSGFRMGKKDSFFKVFCDRVLNLIVRILFGLKLRDTNCALKLVKGEFLRKINIESMGFPAPTEIVIKLLVNGAKLGEAGITHLQREKGLSKLRPIRTGINMLKFLIWLRIKISLYRKRIITEV